jgi:hypothetical protein
VNCQETRKLLPEYGDGHVPTARRGDLDAHLAGCADCRGAADEAKNLDVLLRKAVRVPEPPAEYWARQERRVLQASGRRGLPLRAIAAAALVVAALGLYALTRPAPPAPAPRKDVAETPRPPKPAPVPEKAPPVAPKETPAAPAPVPVRSTAVLPGDPGYLERLTDENLEVGLAETASDRVLGLIRAADGRLSDLRAALDVRNESIAEDLATAYTMIVKRGIGSVLDDRDDGGQDLATARVVARSYAGDKMRALTALEPETRGTLKNAIHDALAATRELASR